MAIPVGYVQHVSGYWFRPSDQSGPYVFDGTTLTLVPQGGTGTSSGQVQGNVGNGTADSGNSVKIGGLANTGVPVAVLNGQRVDAFYTQNGMAVASVGVSTASADGQTNSSVAPFATNSGTFPLAVMPIVFNGTTWDRPRGNIDTAALLTYAAAAAGSNGADQTNYNGRGVKLVVDITALTGTAPTLTVTIQGKDAASGKYYNILASTALAAVATTTLEVYPGIANAANATQGLTLPRTWRVIAVIAGTIPTVTATVGASLIV